MNLITKVSIALFYCLFALFSCKNDSTEGNTTTKFGNKFFLHKDVPGETLKKDYVAFCRVNRWVDDSLDLSSDFRSQLLPFTIGDPKDITKEAFVQDILSNLSLGDSISAYQEMDSLSLIKYKTSKSKRFIMNLKVDSIGEPGSSAAYFEYLQNTQNPLFIERAKIGELSKETLKAQIDLYKNQSKQGYVEIDSSIQMKSISKFNNEKLGYHNWIIFDVVSIFEDGSSFMNSYNSVSSNYINNANYSTIGGIHTALANMSEGEEAVFYIPFGMAYKQDGGGVVPPNTNLFLHIKVHKVIPDQLGVYKKKYGIN